ncbi:MAG: hypothetical protein E6J50_00890 [Chloroflexi bacterium]|nr:MAG: hypothetical protein E6J50_00890 [Chloroflexota bacterium]
MIGSERRRGSGGAAVLGALLIAVGLLFLADQYWNLDLGHYGWPIYVIGLGLAVVLLGLTQRSGSGLTTFGSMVTVLGLILFYQNLTGHWDSWAYAWTLIAPGGSGVGMALYGVRVGNAGMVRVGLWQIVTALGLFAAGFLFFEGLVGISGRRFPLPNWVLPLAVIVLGLLLLFRGFTARQDAHHGESDEPSWPSRTEGDSPG